MGFSNDKQDVPMPNGYSGGSSDFTIVRNIDGADADEPVGDEHRNAYHVGRQELKYPEDD